MKGIYASSQGEGTDPRFVKLETVFRGSKLNSSGTQRYSGCSFLVVYRGWDKFLFMN